MFAPRFAFVISFALLTVCQFAQADTPLRIVTFNAEILTAPGIRAGNLQKYRWDVARSAQFERVAAIIEGLSPDILNLVEVTSKEGVDLLIKILHEKGMTDYRGYHVENNDNYTGMDVALISRLVPDKIEGELIRTINSEANDPTWRQSFRGPSRSGDSMIQMTTSISRNGVYYFTIEDHRLGFIGLHLKSNPSDKYANAKRTAQAKVVQRVIHQEIVGRDYLPIVLGDINDYDPDVPDGDDTRDTVTTVLQDIKDFDADRPGPELVNVAQRMPRQKDRYTSFWDRNENGVRDPYDVFTMIDHILLPKELMPLVKRAFIFHSVGSDTSDHLPVVVDLLLPTKK